MTSAFVIADDDVAALERDLAAAGVAVVGIGPPATLLRDVLRAKAQIVVARWRQPAPVLLPALAALRAHAPLPVLLFTQDGETDTLAAAIDAGVDACVVGAYSAARLRPLLQLARLRFERDHRQHLQWQALSERFEERKLVDRAKGILMGAGQLGEDEAFRLLRVGSMRLKQRVGQMSQQVIEAAHCAQAINRAGALRMLSQRVVLQRALALAGIDAQQAMGEMQTALARADANLAELGKLLSASTYGDLIEAVRGDWQALAAVLGQRDASSGLRTLDARAEACLRSADRLVAALEAAGFGGEPHVVNLSGRQRMLGQRRAKQLLLAALAEPAEAGRAGHRVEPDEVIADFEQALRALEAAPLGDRALREQLAQAGVAWAALGHSAGQLATEPGRRALASASESLLRIFEDLTDRYERSLELLIG